MRFFIDEIKELVISAVVLGFCFAWVLRHGYDEMSFPTVFLLMMIAVGLAFIGHELAHKAVAQKYGCWAKYKMWETGLIFAFLMAVSPIHIVFAAPGAVYIQCDYYTMSRRESGLISAAGASANLVLAIMFLMLSPIPGFIGTLRDIGFFINTWLALFNMIPFPPLDGYKVMSWDFRAWALIVFTGLFLFSIY